ncbi:exosortase A [Kineobactrum salinum]|uniref:Exosortase A n=1 Tax=Kineobactrum salinum TaxID=2708301 RepID=A0A6C0TYW1_9GAMM|nr:exosortase A [Kineobactrum salinum]QIB64723.1 exosortase A [Kineobactrum salinum]
MIEPNHRTDATDPRRGGLLAVIVAVYSVAVIALYHETAASMLRTWQVSETFAHGFLIVPLSLWLVWRLRRQLPVASARPQPWALVFTFGGNLAWLLAYLVDVLVLQQLALVGIIITGIWAILGTALTLRLAFPLGFLFLAVPMGEGLILPMMELTADTTEWLVRASGVPVYREGMYLSLPSGDWSIVEACSGVRYLIASFTLGLLYAHLTYRSHWRQAAFVLASIVVPIVANSLRAYFIVMLGHISDMRIATGVDHLIYGWVFFGIVMLLLFWVGGFWQESGHAEDQSTASGAAIRGTARTGSAFLPVLVLAMVVAGLGPLASLWLERGEDDQQIPVALSAPPVAPAWRETEAPRWDWAPDQRGADRELSVYYQAAAPVGLFLHQYLQQRPGVELVQGVQSWRSASGAWKVKSRRSFATDFEAVREVDEVVLTSGRDQLLVWAWYRIDDHHTHNPYYAKLLEAKQQLLQGEREGSRLFLATAAGDDLAPARDLLRQFLEAHLAGIETILENSRTTGEAVP